MPTAFHIADIGADDLAIVANAIGKIRRQTAAALAAAPS
jgi:hypothetical protein